MADTGIFTWLDRASRCGDVDVERSAEMLKNYYEGIGPEPEYQEVGQSNDRQMTVKQDSDGWPGEIYLQAGDDPLSHFSEYDEVSWCDHPQGESDVRYVRADEPIAALASRPAEVDDLFGPQRFLNWNRSQEVPPVAIGKEIYVAQKAVELSKSAPSHTTNKEK
jgi:hypothetical protein